MSTVETIATTGERVRVLSSQDIALQGKRQILRFSLPAWSRANCHKRDRWSLGVWLDYMELRVWYQETLTTLAAYRNRYHDNLKYKHHKIIPPARYLNNQGVVLCQNFNFTHLDIDQWAIENALTTIKQIQRIAKIQGVIL